MAATAVSSASAVRPEPGGRFYLPELDILRFFAFLWMFFVHASITFPASDTNARPRIIDAGFYTVDLFFALSAYLLTQLLVRELARRGKADVRAFYLRRLLRIWPLISSFLGLAFILSNSLQRFALCVIVHGEICIFHGVSVFRRQLRQRLDGAAGRLFLAPFGLSAPRNKSTWYYPG